MVVARREHRRALRLVRVCEPPAHVERIGHSVGKCALERGPPLLQALQPELHPHEEGAAFGIGRVLVRAEDVGVALGEEAGDRGHDPVPVGARDEQPCGLLALTQLGPTLVPFGRLRQKRALVSLCYRAVVPKQRATFSLDPEVLRATRVTAARDGRRDSEIVEDALRSYLMIGVLGDIWKKRGPSTPELTADEALQLARKEQHAAREQR
jgi:hypothetical protein